MVDRLLMHPMQEAENRKPMETTSKSGWSAIPAGYQRMIYTFPSDESYAVDKKLWDWTMPGWVVFEYVRAKFRQVRGDKLRPGEEARLTLWHWLVWRRIYYTFGPGSVLAEPSGVCWRQTYWGLMKSGSLITLSMNGAAQAFQHALAWSRMRFSGDAGSLLEDWPPVIWTMGDDTLMRGNEEWVSWYRRELSRTGCLVKMVENAREFAGFRVEGDSIADAVVTPIYPEKHKYVIQHMKPADEYQIMLSFSLIYALAKPGWFTNVVSRSEVPVGPMQRLWAKGLVRLELFDTVPEWSRF